ncbi:M36 family metallopeptidase [Empedobacter falsenii]
MKKNQFKALLLLPFFTLQVLQAQNHELEIKNYFQTNTKSSKSFNQSNDFKIINVDPSKSLKGDVVIVQQKIDGIPVFNRSATFLITGNKIDHVTDGFDYNISKINAKSQKEIINEKNAFLSFANSIQLKNASSYSLDKESSKVNEKRSLIPNKVDYVLSEFIYFISKDEAKLAYKFVFRDKNSGNGWLAIVDAITSEVLLKTITTINDHFHENDSFLSQNYNTPDTKKTVAYPLIDKSIKVESFASGAKYNIFKLPVEAPTFGNRTIINDPINDTYAPLGWNNTNNPDLDFFKEYSFGNNTMVYSDENNLNVLADLNQLVYAPEQNFDFQLDITKDVDTYRDASLANLFYMNNAIHDISYQFGFTETARNFQYTNLDRGGVGDDYVIAEGRDGGAYDNANFLPLSEGYPPVMQMYLWSPKFYNGIKVNSPESLANFSANTKYPVDVPKFPLEGITGDLVVSIPENGCTPFNNNDEIKNKIVLIKRGDCSFQEKYINAGNASAKAIIYYNATDQQQIGSYNSGVLMSPEEPAFYSVLIDHKAGETLKNALKTNENLNLRIDKDFTSQPDGSLDNGIIAHEYAHGISNRLTSIGEHCLLSTESNEQMGEGWSDYIALMLTLKPTDNASIARGMGTYALNEDTNGLGIRPAKYSPDFKINDYTYGRTNGMEIASFLFGISIGTSPDVHSIGFVWNTMLWDLTWKYVEKYGYNYDVTADKNSGTARALQLIIDGMKLQKCNPSFVDGRDAILAADEKQTGGENKCMIWNVFSKRGLGVKADPGGLNGLWYEQDKPNPDLYDQVEDFTVPKECELSTTDINTTKTVNISPNPAKDEVYITAKNLNGNYQVKIYNMTGSLVKDVSYNPSYQKSINVSNLTNGVYVIKIEGEKINHSQKLIIKK